MQPDSAPRDLYRVPVYDPGIAADDGCCRKLMNIGTAAEQDQSVGNFFKSGGQEHNHDRKNQQKNAPGGNPC